MFIAVGAVLPDMDGRRMVRPETWWQKQLIMERMEEVSKASSFYISVLRGD